eukprot:2554480-Rhodomonas_salina.2
MLNNARFYTLARVLAPRLSRVDTSKLCPRALVDAAIGPHLRFAVDQGHVVVTGSGVKRRTEAEAEAARRDW